MPSDDWRYRTITTPVPARPLASLVYFAYTITVVSCIRRARPCSGLPRLNVQLMARSPSLLT